MKNLRPAGIIGLGSYLPDKILTNSDLEKIVDTSDEWIRTRTGILERRVTDKKTSTSDLAVKASLNAIKSAKITPKEIDFIIVATTFPDMYFPSTACIVQEKIGAINAGCMDIEAACSGFIYGLSIARQYIATGEYNNVLVIGAETLSKIVDWSDRNTCVLFGDGAGAAIVGHVKEGKGILSTYLGADGKLADLICVPAGGSKHPASHETVDKKMHYMKMMGNEVFKHAVIEMEKSLNWTLEKSKLSGKDISLLVPHQANIRIIELLAKRMNLSMSKVYINLYRYGNTSAASIPIALDEALREGRIKDGDVIAMVAFGAGLTMASCIMKW
ncbi:MAG: beta-ketoacyl-ACP synthase III [Candidatus Firestonebacteria bacterium]